MGCYFPNQEEEDTTMSDLEHIDSVLDASVDLIGTVNKNRRKDSARLAQTEQALEIEKQNVKTVPVVRDSIVYKYRTLKAEPKIIRDTLVVVDTFVKELPQDTIVIKDTAYLNKRDLKRKLKSNKNEEKNP